MIWGCLAPTHQESIPYYPKHYSAYSLIDRYQGIKQVFVFWYCLERRESHNSYAQLVAGYNRLPARYRRKTERYIDRLFSQSEMVLLKKHIQETYGFDIRFVAESFPLDAATILTHVYPEMLMNHQHMNKFDVKLPSVKDLKLSARGVYELRM